MVDEEASVSTPLVDEEVSVAAFFARCSASFSRSVSSSFCF